MNDPHGYLRHGLSYSSTNVVVFVLLLQIFCIIPRAYGNNDNVTTTSIISTSATTTVHHCKPCNPSRCPTLPKACNRTTLDRCRCCAICERALNESCASFEEYDSGLGAAKQIGICQPGLVCVNSSGANVDNDDGQTICTDPNDEDGGSCEEKLISKGCTLYFKIGCRCKTISSCVPVEFTYEDETTCVNDWIKMKAMWRERCLKAKCAVVFQPKCPDDSTLVSNEAPEPPDCCQKPGSCQCNTQACKNMVPKCPPDHDLVRIEKGTNMPGSCCDMYKCMPPVLDCSLSNCPPVTVKDCPEDSYHPPNQKTSTSCCPLEEQCVCNPGGCQPIACPEDHRLAIVKKGTGTPGNCCDQFECVPPISDEQRNCDYDIAGVGNGVTYSNGKVWYPTPCLECSCKDGLIFCKKHECPDSHDCSVMRVPNGECCPVCTGCTSENGDFHNITETWKKDDCTTCTCENSGKILCHKQMCSIDCDNPVKIPGQCCPVCEKPVIITLPFVCPSIELCSIRCEHGMKRDLRGCFICECNADDSSWRNNTLEDPQSNDNCPYWDESVCHRKCFHGYEHDHFGCPVCKCKGCPTMHQCYKSCLHGFQSNSYGCTICKCKGEPLSTTTSTDLIAEEEDYPSCQLPASTHDHGEWWFDGCRYCYCDRGREFCSVLACPTVNCVNPQFDENGCCPNCGEVTSSDSRNRLVCHAPGTGRNFVEGEFWSLGNCVECTCHIGHVLCHRRPCRPTPCAKPKSLSGQCCPICERADSTGNNNKNNNNNNINSRNDSHCTIENVAYSSGSLWKSNLCTSCTCRGGNVDCFDESCPPLNCAEKLLHLKNVCCPICAGDFTQKLCRYKDMAYSVGEQWRDGLCRNCTCNENSDVLCTQFECAKCPENSTIIPGQCCPVCDMGNRNWFGKSTNEPPILGTYDQAQHLTVVLVLCSVGLLAIIFVVVLIFYWWRKRTVRHHSTSSSSSRSEPILGGYRFHERQSMIAKSSNNHPIVVDSKKNGTLISPYDSDGASTGLTSEGV